MYVKLAVGSAKVNSQRCMRDIGRLLTSATPNTSILEAFSQSSSVVIDSTPAGWTYVGSTFAGDRPTIAVANSAVNLANNTFPNLAFSAPCLNGTTKYCALTTYHYVASNELNNNHICLSGAQYINANGVCTNEGGRVSGNSASNLQSASGPLTLKAGAAGTILHLIASPRHITIIESGKGVQAVWEMSATDLNTFYNTAPFVQYSHADTSSFTRFGNSTVPVDYGASTGTSSASIMHTGFNVTDPNTATTYGTFDPTQGLNTNLGFFARAAGTGFLNPGINAVGLPKYNIMPVILSNDKYGHPTQYITGIVPVYFIGPGIGTSGDTVDVNGDTYYFFDSGTGYGLIMKLS
jgi:hypothetical protein